jgi:hypothetical protein
VGSLYVVMLIEEELMSDNPSQKRYPVDEPWGPIAGLDPVQEYRVLAHELREVFPDAEPRHLDRMIAREMALYGGYSVAVITQAMVQASLHLAGGNGDEAQDYVDRTVDEAMQQEPADDTVLGWGV